MLRPPFRRPSCRWRAASSWLEDSLRQDFTAAVDVVDERHAGSDVELEHLVARELVELHHDRAQAVAVGGDEHVPAGGDLGKDPFFEIRERARGSVFEAFAFRRSDVVASPPDVDLLLAVLLGGFRLVESLQGAVVALVERLVALDRNSVRAKPVEHDAKRFLRARKIGRERAIEMDAGFFQQLAGAGRFGAAELGQWNVDPPGEPVLEVPLRLTMTDESESRHRVLLESSSSSQQAATGAASAMGRLTLWPNCAPVHARMWGRAFSAKRRSVVVPSPRPG